MTCQKFSATLRNVLNGTQCRGVGIKLKDDAEVVWKNWDGKRVKTVGVDDVEYILCELLNQSSKKTYFRLKPETDQVTISLKMHGNYQKIGGIKITQFGVNCNIAATGHKLQGTSKDSLIVGSWNYTFENWIYVVLSRVRTLKGLFLCEKLDLTKPFRVIKEVLIEESRLENIQDEVLKIWMEQTETEFN